MAARGHIYSPALAPKDKLRVAFMHIIGGVEQHILAAGFNVNPGRVAEAVTAVRDALGIKPEPRDAIGLKPEPKDE
jgi:hypothetical protein